MSATKIVKNLVYNNKLSGSEQVKSFKSIIRESVYPEYPEHFSPGGMAIAIRTFKAYEKSCGDQEELRFDVVFYGAW